MLKAVHDLITVKALVFEPFRLMAQDRLKKSLDCIKLLLGATVLSPLKLDRRLEVSQLFILLKLIDHLLDLAALKDCLLAFKCLDSGLKLS